VGLEDRDWYREEPSRAWSDFRRGRTRGRRRLPSPSYADPFDDASCEFGGRVRSGAWLAILVSGAIALMGWRVGLPDVLRLPSPSPASTPAREAVVRLGGSGELDVPATAPAEWSMTDPRFGTVRVRVAIGQTPRQAFVIALAARGY
jgi:hypothetical protein